MNRRSKLLKLIDERFGGNQSMFAKAIKKAPAQVNHWTTGHRALGDAGARNIEITLGLKQGYFDGRAEDGIGSPHVGQAYSAPDLERSTQQALKSSGIACQRVTRDTALPDELKISQDRWFRPDLVCELEGIRVFVEVTSSDKKGIYELLQRQLPALVVITPETVDQAAQTVRARVQEIKANKDKLDLIAALRTLYEQTDKSVGYEVSVALAEHLKKSVG